MQDFKLGDKVKLMREDEFGCSIGEVIRVTKKWIFVQYDNGYTEKHLRMEISLLPPAPFEYGQTLCVDVSRRKILCQPDNLKFLAKFLHMIDGNYAYLSQDINGESHLICAHIDELSECLIDFDEEAA